MGFLVVLFGLLALFAVGRSVEPLPGDRELLITADELNERYGLEMTLDPSAELFERRDLFLGSYELNYEYEHPEDSPDVLYVSSTITHESNGREAGKNYMAMDIAYGTLMEVLGDGVETQERPGLLDWGERSKAGWLVYESSVIGAYAIAQDGKNVYDTIIVGIEFDDAELRALLGEHLDAMTAAL